MVNNGIRKVLHKYDDEFNIEITTHNFFYNILTCFFYCKDNLRARLAENVNYHQKMMY